MPMARKSRGVAAVRMTKIDTRALRYCVKSAGTQFRDGTKSLEPQNLKPGYRLQLVRQAHSEVQGRHHRNRDIGAARYNTRIAGR